MDDLRAATPSASLDVRRADDRVTLLCVDTGHAVSWRSESEGRDAIDAMRRHLGGKKFRAARAARRNADALREYEPHIVRSRFVDGYVFCRVTGSRVRATEEAVVTHASGRRFARAHAAALRSGTLLEERSPEEEEREREERRMVAKAKAKANADARRALKEQRAAEKAKRNAERKRLRENGGFDEEMGCWKPPANVIGSDDEDDDDEGDDEVDDDEASASDEDEEHNDLEDDFYEDDDDSDAEESDSDDEEEEVAIVRRPGFGKKRRTK